jgi:hypothetical protein
MKEVGSTRSLSSSGNMNWKRKKRKSKLESQTDEKDLLQLNNINLSESGIVTSLQSNKHSESHSM